MGVVFVGHGVHYILKMGVAKVLHENQATEPVKGQDFRYGEAPGMQVAADIDE